MEDTQKQIDPITEFLIYLNLKNSEAARIFSHLRSFIDKAELCAAGNFDQHLLQKGVFGTVTQGDINDFHDKLISKAMQKAFEDGRITLEKSKVHSMDLEVRFFLFSEKEMKQFLDMLRNAFFDVLVTGQYKNSDTAG